MSVIRRMTPARKVHSTKRHKLTRKWIMAVSIPLLVAMILTVTYVWNPANSPASNAPNEPAGLKILADHYTGIMRSLNSSQTKTEMEAQLDPNYNQTDLFAWEQNKMTFAQDPMGWYENPTQILNSGKGICVQWSIVYVSACLALGYQSRLVAAVNTASWNYIHVWAEDYYNGTWIHVDPSDKVWNNPSRYQSWNWGKIGSEVRIFAFDDRKFQEVTSNYSFHG